MSEERSMPPGKVSAKVLYDTVFQYLGVECGDVVLGPRLGEDAAILRWGDEYLIVSTDPITAGGREVGWLAVHISANDVAVSGAKPLWFLSSIMIPEGFRVEELERIAREMDEAAKAIGVTIIGGHTEVTPGIGEPIIVGMAMGRTKRYIMTGGGRPGDKILLTKGVGLEGTSILASTFEERLRKDLSEDVIRAGRGLRERISVVPEATTLAEEPWLLSMHDPTEGGLFLGLHEMADASSLGMRIYEEAIHTPEPVAEICRVLEVDPCSLLGSGALLATIEKGYEEEAITLLSKHGIPSWILGEFTARERELVRRDGSKVTLPRPQSDEIWRFI